MAFGPSLALYERLKTRYAHFYFRIGPNPKGLESCLFVASQYALVSEPLFVPFHGYTWMKRGYFCLETPQFWVVTTHMEPKDKRVRVTQFRQITRKMQELAQTKPCFLLGDLNFDRMGKQEDEYTQLEVAKHFHDPHPSLDVGTCTDALVTHMRGKKKPERLWEILDYALFMPSERVTCNFNLHLQVIRNACNLEEPHNALSDHRALYLRAEKKEGRSA
jgi:endonuclease/exonuclease/phosphatase family metal-dependent hydrolase